MLVDSDQDFDGGLLVCAVVEEIESLNREFVSMLPRWWKTGLLMIQGDYYLWTGAKRYDAFEVLFAIPSSYCNSGQ